MNAPQPQAALPSQAASQAAAVGRWAGPLLAMAGAVAFSGKAIIVKLAYRYGVDAVTLIMLRMVVALPFFVLMCWWAGRGRAPLPWRDRWIAAALGFCGYYLSSFLDFLGLQHITASLERLILYLTPSVVLLLSWALYGRRASGRQWAAMALAYFGLVLVFGHELTLDGPRVALGAGLVVASMLSYACYLLYSGEVVQRIGAMRLTGWASAVACVLCLLQFSLLRPLDAIRAGAQRFSAGEFGLPIAVQRPARPDELGQLAATINTMGQDIHQMLEAKRALLLAISHELRSPLTRARLNTELLPESSDAATRARASRRYPGALEAEPPPALQRVIARIGALLGGARDDDLTDIQLDQGLDMFGNEGDRRHHHRARHVPHRLRICRHGHGQACRDRSGVLSPRGSRRAAWQPRQGESQARLGSHHHARSDDQGNGRRRSRARQEFRNALTRAPRCPFAISAFS